MSNTNKNLFLQKKRSSSFRSDKSTIKKKKSLKDIVVKGPWSPKENELLKKWIETVGPKKWTKCALGIPGRSGKQCREHWNNSLNSNILKGNWTVEEDYLLMLFYEKMDKSWKKMIPLFKSRTENSIKNRFFSQLRKIASKYIKTGKREYSTKFGLSILLKYYEEGLQESKNLFLKNSNMNENELDEYINDIEKMLKNKPKEEKFIDIKPLRKSKDLDIKDNAIIDIKVSEEEKYDKLNKTNEKNEGSGKINKIKEVKNINIKKELENKNDIIDKDESILSEDAFDLVIKKPKSSKANIQKKIKHSKEIVIEKANNNINVKEELNKNVYNNDAINDKNNILNNNNNANYNIHNTINIHNINYNINNNGFNNINYNNMNNITSANTSASNLPNNFNNSNNPKNPTSFQNNNSFNMDLYRIERNNQNSCHYMKKASDLSEEIVEEPGNYKNQCQVKNSSDVFALLNSHNYSNNYGNLNENNINNNNDFIGINSNGFIDQNLYWNGLQNFQSGKMSYDDKKFIPTMTPIMDRKFQFPIFRHFESNDYNKGMFHNFPSGTYGFNRMGSITSIKDYNINTENNIC